MNITMKLRSILAVLSVVLLAACQGAPVHLGTDGAVYVRGANAQQLEAEACGFQLLLVIPINNNTRHLRAWNRLRAQAYGKSLTNVQVKESWFWAAVGTVYCTTLSATVGDSVAVPVSRAMPMAAPAPETVVAPIPEPVAVPAPAPAPAPVQAAAPVAAPVPAAAVMPVAPPAAPVKPAVPAMNAATAQASAKDGASLRSAPVRVSAGAKIVAILPAGTPLILKQKISNANGEWWFVSAESKGEGWILATELDLIKR